MPVEVAQVSSQLEAGYVSRARRVCPHVARSPSCPFRCLPSLPAGPMPYLTPRDLPVPLFLGKPATNTCRQTTLVILRAALDGPTVPRYVWPLKRPGMSRLTGLSNEAWIFSTDSSQPIVEGLSWTERVIRAPIPSACECAIGREL